MSKVFQEEEGNEPCSMLQEANKMTAEIIVGKNGKSRCFGVVSRENRRWGDASDIVENSLKRTWEVG